MNNERPLILVTNDDGITAKGLLSLVEAVEEFGDLVIVAPDKPQSGMGHAITVNNMLRLDKSSQFEGRTAYSCSGTPVDCVKLAIYEIMHRRPTLLVSGVNHGANCSTNILYSGTMSAAVEGALEGIPSIGFSLLDFAADADFSVTKGVIKKILANVLKHELGEGVCLNVNVPKATSEEFKGIKFCRQAKAYWEDKFDHREDPFGKDYYWLTGDFKTFDKGEDTDLWALENNYASVVPIHYDMTAHRAIASLNDWDI